MLKTLAKLLLIAGGALPAAAQEMLPASPAMQMGAAPARPQFTFRVPVRVSAIHPEVTRVVVRCYVYESSPAGGPMARTQWDGVVPVDSAGNFNGTVVVSGSLPPDADPNRAQSYVCNLTLFHGDFVYAMGCPTTDARCDAWRAYKPDTPFHPQAVGRLP